MKPADLRRPCRVAGSTATIVSPKWIIRMSVDGRLSTPAKTPPGLRTRYTSAKSWFCSANEGTWWSIVNETTAENKQLLYGIAVASPCCTWTFELSKRCPREFASAESISRHSTLFTRFRRQSVVKPGPGPISNTESRSSISRSVHGRISSCIVRFQ